MNGKLAKKIRAFVRQHGTPQPPGYVAVSHPTKRISGNLYVDPITIRVAPGSYRDRTQRLKNSVKRLKQGRANDQI